LRYKLYTYIFYYLRYFYKFGSASSGWSETFSFMSPQAQVPTEEVYIVAYGGTTFRGGEERRVPIKLTLSRYGGCSAI
jgi:hypothetical protein